MQVERSDFWDLGKRVLEDPYSNLTALSNRKAFLDPETTYQELSRYAPTVILSGGIKLGMCTTVKKGYN